MRYAADVTPTLGFVVGGFGFRQTIDSTGKQEQGSAAARFLLAPGALAATPGSSTATARPRTSARRMSAQRSSASSNGHSPIVCACCPACDSTTTRRRSTTTRRSMAVCRRRIRADRAAALDSCAAGLSGRCRRHQRLGPGDGGVSDRQARQRLCDLRDQLQVGRPEPRRCTHQRRGSARARGRDSQTRGRASHRSRPEDRAAARCHRQSHRLQHRHQGLPGASRQRQCGRASWLPRNAEKVRVRGVEFDGSARVHRNLSFYGAAAYTDGTYVSFPDAPPPLEETGGPQVKDISGSDLPGISKWALSLGGESVNPASLLGRAGELFAAVDASYRSRSRRMRAPHATWSLTAMPCSTPGRLPVGGRMVRLSLVPEPPGQTTSSCCPRRPAALACTSACLGSRERSG